jgi:membrane protein implicated in regulation of membrane protease activity
MHRTLARLTACALLAGTVIATAGYLTAFLANGNGDARYTGSSWTALYTIALFGDVLIVLGLPALLHTHGERSRTLTLIGYAGTLVPLVVLDVGEGCVEAFVKPYLAKHGGLPSHDLPGLEGFEMPAVLTLVVGLVCLGIAVFRAGVLPRWVGVAFIVSPVAGIAGLSGGAGLISDYLAFLGLFAVGVHTLRAASSVGPARPAVPVPSGV